MHAMHTSRVVFRFTAHGFGVALRCSLLFDWVAYGRTFDPIGLNPTSRVPWSQTTKNPGEQ